MATENEKKGKAEGATGTPSPEADAAKKKAEEIVAAEAAAKQAAKDAEEAAEKLKATQLAERIEKEAAKRAEADAKAKAEGHRPGKFRVTNFGSIYKDGKFFHPGSEVELTSAEVKLFADRIERI